MVRQQIALALKEAGIIHSNGGYPDLTNSAERVLERRYLGKDREGNVLEDPDGMFRRVALDLSLADLEYGASEGERLGTEEEFYRAMRRLELMPNSPTLMNAGRELQQLSACFVLPVDDSLEDIFETLKRTALIHKSGGGTGFSFNRVRPAGDIVGSTGGVASGPVGFIRAFDTATDVVKQGGTRRGANMAILNVDHPDIMAFVESKADKTSLSNFNISVAVTTEFMERLRTGEDYDLVNPRTGEVTGRLNTREVFQQISAMAWETGDPGVVFLDRINEDNPNPQLGKIESTNPCGETPLSPFESCNLASVNLARMTRKANDGGMEMDWDRLAEGIRTTVHMLDNVIDRSKYPIEQIEEMSKKTRRIGLGVMGFADLLIQMGLGYDTEEAVAFAGEVMQRVQEETHRASSWLAGSRGSFPAWEGSIYGPEAAAVPMRNSAPTTIAPTGTISIIAGASGGVEPLFALSFVRNVMDNTRLVEANPYFEAVARSEGFYSEELMEELAQKGSLSLISPRFHVPQWVKDVFRTSHDIAPEWHVRMQAAFQSYTDNAVSKTINLPEDATIEDVADAYMLAYELGCKGITVYRDGSKAEQVLSTGGEQSKAEPEKFHRTRERPAVMRGVTERVRSGHGNMYVTVNLDMEGRPFEVFANQGKAGGCDSAQIEGVSRLATLALRSGVDPEVIVEQLRGITCCPAWDGGIQIKSAPDALALVLARCLEGQAPRYEAASEGVQPRLLDFERTAGVKCPDCGSALTYQEGCLRCTAPDCGWSKCE